MAIKARTKKANSHKKPTQTSPAIPRASAKHQPKVALVCDWLTNPGGAEKVLLELHRMYPDAPIFTSQYNRQKITWFKDADVRTGWLKFFPSSLRNFLGVFRQIYFSHLDLSEYDVVISVTGAEAKSVKVFNKKTKSRAYHLCYCHVPTQYYWQKYDDYVKNPGFGILNPLARLGLKLLVKPLRRADYRAAQKPDQFVTISHYAAEQIKKYYHREAKIVFPAVDVAKFAPASDLNEFSTEKSTETQDFSTLGQSLSTKKVNLSTENQKISTEQTKLSTGKCKFSTGCTEVESGVTEEIKNLFANQPYFIISCRQVGWKRVDLAIAACKATGDNLLVVGRGPEHESLVKLASGAGNIIFLPWQSSASLAELLQHASAYIFPSEEPFGIAAAEALAAGCPVLAYGEGGSRDIVIPGKNGLLFPDQTPTSVASVIREFKQLTSASSSTKSDKLWSPAQISASAEQFSAIHFDAGIRALVDQAEPHHEESETDQSQSHQADSIISDAEPVAASSQSRTLLDELILTLLLCLPFALFMSYHPVIKLGATSSMNLELSVPLLWLVVFDVAIVIKFFTLLWQKNNSQSTVPAPTSGGPLTRLLDRSIHFPGITDRKIFLLALFPLYATISVFWSGNPFRGLLTAGIIWALFLAVFAILFIVPLINLPTNFRRNLLRAIFLASLGACAICLIQSVADVCGVDRETTLLCRGCTYQSFGFPHPSGLAIEPQFMGNLLLAPTLLGLYLIVFRQQKSLALTITTFICSFTLFFTFSRGAIYAYAVALAFLFVVALAKKARFQLLLVIPIVSFLASLTMQGIMAAVGPTSDNFVTATTKAIHHLSLGVIDLRPEQEIETSSEQSAEKSTSSSDSSDSNHSSNASNSGNAVVSNGSSDVIKPENSSHFSGYVSESTDVRLNLNTIALLTWRNAPGRHAIWQGFKCPLNGTPCLGSRQITPSSMYFGVGLGGAGTAMHEAYPSDVTSPKEIVQNQPISLLLELGVFGIDLLLFELIICFCPWFFSRRFVDGRRATAQPAGYTNFWHNRYWILLTALGIAYLISLNFFSGLPNALHIYLLPPLIYWLGGNKTCSEEQKELKTLPNT